MQRRLSGLILFLCVTSAISVQASWYVGGSAGVSFPSVSHHDDISSGQGWPLDRYTNTGVDSTPLFSLETGYQWAYPRAWLPFYSLGASYTYVFASKVKGNVDQYALPQFENYNNQYDIQWQTFLATMKIDLYRWHYFMPFISLGAGFSLNNASNYTEQATPGVTPRDNPAFQGETNSYLAYTLGAGMDYIIQQNLWATLRYEYSHNGYAQTGVGANTNTLTGINYSSDRLKTKLSSNAVLFSVTYFIDPVA